VAAAYKTVRTELAAYGHGLTEKPEILALSKADALTPEDIKSKLAKLKRAAKKTPLVLSAASGAGVPEVLRALRGIIDEAREASGEKPREEDAAAAWRP
jgi:GTPase